MTVDRPLRWTDYKVGMTKDELIRAGLNFRQKEWDLGGEGFVGQTFSQLIPTLIKESRFHPGRFNTPRCIGNFQGGIIQANFKIYEANPHELPGQLRQTGTGKVDYWLPVAAGLDGELDPMVNPLIDPLIAKRGMVVGLASKVLLNNLSVPGSYGGVAHFPLLDIVHPPTPENAKHLISEIKSRCGLERFFVLRSSDKGMMIVGPELMDEENFVAFLLSSLGLNHMEIAGEYWVDDRWVYRSSENLVAVTGNRINPWRYAGILRATALDGIKPEPHVIAASF